MSLNFIKLMKNPELERARQIVEWTGTNLFLTGKAGTGKTTFLRQLRERNPKRMVILAPTGVAAINAGGSTIHSFFQFDFGPYLPGLTKMEYKLRKDKVKLIRSLDLIVIDEISMVRGDMMDRIDELLRHYRTPFQPFGGVQLLLIGDLQQLAPVVKDDEWELLRTNYPTPYFFSSRALNQSGYATIELHHVYRQSDPHFVELLNRVRSNTADAEVLRLFNERYVPDFEPPEEAGYVRLVTHNQQARAHNAQELERLSTKEYVFEASVEGVFPESSYPTDEELVLKQGAQVMFVKNDVKHRYFNGMLGTVEELTDKRIVVCPFDNDERIEVDIDAWENTRYEMNPRTKEVEERIVGMFKQYPLKLAWAITVHKSQGLPFEHAIIDVHAAFAAGQTYVALSRCKSLEGMVLSAPIPPRAIITDANVDRYHRELPARTPDESGIRQLQRIHFVNLIASLFDFRSIEHLLALFLRHLEEHFYKDYPATLERFRKEQLALQHNLFPVAHRFHIQYEQLVAASDDYTNDALLQERISKGATYFRTQVSPLQTLLADTDLASNNKEVLSRYMDLDAELNDAIRQRKALFDYVLRNGFHMADYQRAHALIMAGEKPRKKEKHTEE